MVALFAVGALVARAAVLLTCTCHRASPSYVAGARLGRRDGRLALTLAEKPGAVGTSPQIAR